jgi:hypothetical protein
MVFGITPTILAGVIWAIADARFSALSIGIIMALS